MITPQDLGSLGSRYIHSSAKTITETGYVSCGTTLAPAGSVATSTRTPIGYLAILGRPAYANQGCRYTRGLWPQPNEPALDVGSPQFVARRLRRIECRECHRTVASHNLTAIGKGSRRRRSRQQIDNKQRWSALRVHYPHHDPSAATVWLTRSTSAPPLAPAEAYANPKPVATDAVVGILSGSGAVSAWKDGKACRSLDDGSRAAHADARFAHNGNRRGRESECL